MVRVKIRVKLVLNYIEPNGASDELRFNGVPAERFPEEGAAPEPGSIAYVSLIVSDPALIEQLTVGDQFIAEFTPASAAKATECIEPMPVDASKIAECVEIIPDLVAEVEKLVGTPQRPAKPAKPTKSSKKEA